MKIKGKDYRLPKRFKAKWIKALRSGKYEQGSNFLVYLDWDNTKTFCCLGVACVITGIKEKNIYDLGLIEITNKKEEKLFKDIPKILKGSSEEDDVLYNPLIKKLTQMNDSGKWSFNRIATYIEKYL
jgi:hypothetical protein